MKKAIPFILIIIAAGTFLLLHQMSNVKGNGKNVLMLIPAISIVAGVGMLLLKPKQ